MSETKEAAAGNATVPIANPESDVLGGFTIILKLGQGGMGSVYKARQPMLNRVVALKVMAPHLNADPEFVTRFIHEASSAASLMHPNMVQVYTAGQDTGRYFIAMEFVDGETLHDRIKRDGAMNPAAAVAITIQVAEALNYAWTKNKMIHRDIKPDNIFLSKAGTVKLGDLGLAKNIDNDSSHMTLTGRMMGTPHYMSPEQVQAEKSINFRSDIYSLGCTLYHMITGKTPYAGDSSIVVAMKHVNEQPPSITQACPTCPHHLAKVITRMMAKNPGARHQTYNELIAELKQVYDELPKDGGKPSAPVPPPPVFRAAKKYAAAALAAAMLVGGLFCWTPWKRTQPPATSAQSADSADWTHAINLLPLIDPQKDAVYGTWKLENGELVSDKVGDNSRGDARIQFPYRPPQEYDFRITFTRREGRDSIHQKLYAGERAFDWSMDTFRKHLCGFQKINGDDVTKNLTRAEFNFVNGRKYTSLVQVRKDGVKAYVDDRLISQWATDYHDMSRWAPSHLRDETLLGLGTSGSICVFHCIEVREVTGKGQVIPHGESPTPSSAESRANENAAGDGMRVPAGCRMKPGTSMEPYTKTNWAKEVMHAATGIELVYIPAGTFTMGSPMGEDGRSDDEVQHKVTLSQGFYIGKYEVTQAQWEKIMGGNPSQFKGNTLPVETVSWNDCQSFCGKTALRLPTEAEWEYACRAGSTGAYGGTGALTEMGWLSINSGRTTHPVGQKQPNAWGLYDIYGNVLEWCADWYGAYLAGDVTNPTGVDTGSFRVFRGGCWLNYAQKCRSANRSKREPVCLYNVLGLRVVLSSVQ